VNIYKTPMFKSAMAMACPKGTLAQAMVLQTKLIMGAIKKTSKFAFVGIRGSFTSSLRPSAKGCKRPTKPTTLGPFRL
jgi:hypothetical protein